MPNTNESVTIAKFKKISQLTKTLVYFLSIFNTQKKGVKDISRIKKLALNKRKKRTRGHGVSNAGVERGETP